MRILSKRQLRELVLYSPQHAAGLEKAGAFPSQVNLGPTCFGWVEDEVLDWREATVGSPRKRLTDTPEREYRWPGVHNPATCFDRQNK